MHFSKNVCISLKISLPCVFMEAFYFATVSKNALYVFKRHNMVYLKEHALWVQAWVAAMPAVTSLQLGD